MDSNPKIRYVTLSFADDIFEGEPVAFLTTSSIFTALTGVGGPFFIPLEGGVVGRVVGV